MDYKNTLNLPRTDFPMKADLVAREPERLTGWEKAGLYLKIQAARAQAKDKFVLHDGPPFANGDVHIGTALNKILKDIIVKSKTLRGFNAPYVPGWDCHGLPIEFKVSQEMRKEFETVEWPKLRAAGAVEKQEPGSTLTAEEWESVRKRLELNKYLSPDKVRQRCGESARKYINIQRDQFKRLGVFGDWNNPYLTFDNKYEADELRLFADLVEKGFVYRAKKPVYWCIPCGTALAEAEIEYRDHVSPSIYVKFPVVGQPNTFVLIWTTTPWTLPANLAIAYNDKFQYVEVGVGGEKYILFRGLLPAVAEKCGWSGLAEQPFPTEKLAQLQYQHPFIPARKGKLYAAEFVTSDTGTGFVHIAPGHGLEDYGLGLKHDLPIYSPINDAGCFGHTKDFSPDQEDQQVPLELFGKSILEKHGKSEANEAVLMLLRAKNTLLHQEDYRHSYPHCWRSKNPVIFRAMDQWFIEIDHQKFREQALAEIDQVKWVPDWGVNRIKGAVQTRPDWCISRQRTWGVPIPAFLDGDKWILDAQIIRRFADEVEKNGSNIWFAHDAGYLYTGLRLFDIMPVNDPSLLKKSSDTLDVWIDSGSSSRSVLMRRGELSHRSADGSSASSGQSKQNADEPSALPWQADMYLEGSDQHRGWFQSSLLLSLAGNGAAPYKTVLTHGFMVDADREKISKSKQGQGAYEKPQTSEAYVKKYGADIVRLWVSSQDFRNDIIVSDERIAKVAETYRGIRNALRYQLSNLYNFDPAKHTVPDDKLTGLDRWILGEFSKLEQEIIAAYDQYEFHVVYQKVSQFIAVELSSIYHDVIKDRLYTDPANSHRRRSTQTALHRLVTGLCQMLAPILAFTADEAWEFVPGKRVDSVHQSQIRDSKFQPDSLEEHSYQMLFAVRERVLPELEKARQSKAIGKALEAKVVLSGGTSSAELLLKNWDMLREVLNVSQLKDGGLSVPHLASDFGAPSVTVDVVKADGQKCERCWHWETDVGSNPEHPTICGRCVAAVKEFQAGAQG